MYQIRNLCGKPKKIIKIGGIKFWILIGEFKNCVSNIALSQKDVTVFYIKYLKCVNSWGGAMQISVCDCNINLCAVK